MRCISGKVKSRTIQSFLRINLSSASLLNTQDKERGLCMVNDGIILWEYNLWCVSDSHKSPFSPSQSSTLLSNIQTSEGGRPQTFCIQFIYYDFKVSGEPNRRFSCASADPFGVAAFAP